MGNFLIKSIRKLFKLSKLMKGMANKINIWNRNHNSIKKCEICNKEFKVKWSGLNRRKTCSNECRHKLQSKLIKGNQYGGKGIKKTCPSCKKEFKYSPSQNKKFCSERCYVRKGETNPNWKGGYPKCIECKKELKGRNAFRCKSCANKLDKNPAWRGGIQANQRPRQTIEYYKLRLDIFERDNYICQQCKNRGGKLEMHHKKSWKNYPELRFNKENVITICKECHNKTKGGRY